MQPACQGRGTGGATCSGRCDSYVLMTNAGVSGSAAEEIEPLFIGAGVKQFRMFGSTWICAQIRENKRLRMEREILKNYRMPRAAASPARRETVETARVESGPEQMAVRFLVTSRTR